MEDNDLKYSSSSDEYGKYDSSEGKIGIENFKEMRKKWLERKKEKIDQERRKRKVLNGESGRENIDVDQIVYQLRKEKLPRFKQRVPLGEMVNVLIEMWESDGVFD